MGVASPGRGRGHDGLVTHLASPSTMGPQLGALIGLDQPKGRPLTHLTTLSTTGGRIASQVG